MCITLRDALALCEQIAKCRRYAAEKERKTVDSAGEMMQIVVSRLETLRPLQKFQLGEVVEGVVRSMGETGTSVSKRECAVHCGSWLWVLTWRVCDACLQMMFARQ